mmetsp:Transcript_111191/g.314646  ORF Transcript_111191/g.314646 Transcript_111191/m.314646 type:complete len:206 (-) Transcript_111191:283-900(-)
MTIQQRAGGDAGFVEEIAGVAACTSASASCSSPRPCPPMSTKCASSASVSLGIDLEVTSARTAEAPAPAGASCWLMLFAGPWGRASSVGGSLQSGGGGGEAPGGGGPLRGSSWYLARNARISRSISARPTRRSPLNAASAPLRFTAELYSGNIPARSLFSASATLLGRTTIPVQRERTAKTAEHTRATSAPVSVPLDEPSKSIVR